VTFSNVPSGTGYTVQAAQFSQTASQTVAVTTGNTTNVTLPLTAGTLTVQVRWASVAVSGATVQVTSASRGINQTLTTGGSGNVSFAGLPPGTDYQVMATKSGQSTTLSPVTVTGSPSTVTANLPTGTITFTVRQTSTTGPLVGSNATVRITGGPMGTTFSGTTNGSSQVTLTVPVGTGYTISGWKCSLSNPKVRTLTGQTVASGSTSFTLVLTGSTTCPVP
jgi:hypothetical protein